MENKKKENKAIYLNLYEDKSTGDLWVGYSHKNVEAAIKAQKDNSLTDTKNYYIKTIKITK